MSHLINKRWRAIAVSSYRSLFFIASLCWIVPEVASQENVVRFRFEIEDENGVRQPVKNVIVWVPHNSPTNRERLKNYNQIDSNDPEKTSNVLPKVLEKVNGEMQPRAIYLQTGDELVFRNSSESGFIPNIASFNNPHSIAVPTGTETKRKFLHSDRAPAQVQDDVEDIGTALILVQPHPFGFVSSDDGLAEILGLPTGIWEFQITHGEYGHPSRVLDSEEKTVEANRGRCAISVDASDKTITAIWKQLKTTEDRDSSKKDP